MLIVQQMAPGALYFGGWTVAGGAVLLTAERPKMDVGEIIGE